MAIPDQYKALFKQYDKNADGKLDEDEIKEIPPFLKQRVLDYIRSLPGGDE